MALLEGWEIPRIPPDLEFRKKLEKTAAECGTDELYNRLLKTDPAAALKIDKRNVRRVIRALEVSHRAKISFSGLQKKKDPGFRTLIIGLTAERAELYRRTDDRVEEMVRSGLVEETIKLNQAGFDFSLPGMNSIGYKQVGMMLREEISREEAVRQIKTDNHRFIRHQYAWFKLQDRRRHWFDVAHDISAEVMTLIGNFLDEAE